MEEEIQKLIVRLVGDATSYTKMLSEAQSGAKQAAASVESSAKKIEEFTHKVEGFASGVVSAVKAAAGFEFLHAGLEAFEDSERASFKLSAAIRANGESVAGLLDDYKEWAAQIQATTTYEDEAVMALLKQAKSFGLAGDSAKQATKDAMALAAATDQSAEAMIRFTAAIAKGDLERAMMFTRMIPQLRGIKDETELLARYQVLLAAGFEVMDKETETVGGRIKQLKNNFNDFQETIGRVVSESLLPLADSLARASRGLADLPKWMQEAIVYGVAATTAYIAFGAVWPLITSSVTSATAAVKVLGTVLLANPAIAIGAAIIAAAYALYEFSGAANKVRFAMEEVNSEMDRSKKLFESFDKVGSDATSKILKEAKGMGKEQRDTFLKDKLHDAEKELANNKKLMETFQANIEEERPDWWGRTFRPSVSKAKNAMLDQDAKNLQASYDGVKDRVEKLRGALTGANSIQKQMSDEVDKAVKGMEDQARFAAMTSDGVQLEKLRMQGANEVQMQLAKGALERAAAAKKVLDQEKAVSDTITEMQKKVDALGKSEYQARIGELRKGGLGLDQEKQLDALNEQLEAGQKHADLMARGKEIAKEMQSPAERQAGVMAELNELLQEGAINYETYSRAASRAASSVNSLTTANAALAGSAEDLSRKESYFSHLPNLGAVAPAPAFNPIVPRGAPGNELGAFERNADIRSKLDRIARAAEKTAGKKDVSVKPAGL